MTNLLVTYIHLIIKVLPTQNLYGKKKLYIYKNIKIKKRISVGAYRRHSARHSSFIPSFFFSQDQYNTYMFFDDSI